MVESQTDDRDAKEDVEVVLRWTTEASGLGLEVMDDVTKSELDDVENEERKSNTLIYNSDKHEEE